MKKIWDGHKAGGSATPIEPKGWPKSPPRVKRVASSGPRTQRARWSEGRRIATRMNWVFHHRTNYFVYSPDIPSSSSMSLTGKSCFVQVSFTAPLPLRPPLKTINAWIISFTNIYKSSIYVLTFKKKVINQPSLDISWVMGLFCAKWKVWKQQYNQKVQEHWNRENKNP